MNTKRVMNCITWSFCDL